MNQCYEVLFEHCIRTADAVYRETPGDLDRARAAQRAMKVAKFYRNQYIWWRPCAED